MIWFAPHLRLKNLIETILMEMTLFTTNEGPELSSMVDAGREVWLQMAEQINLAIALRSYPVGIPSLMSSILPLETPLGVPWMLEISSIGYAFLITIVLVGIGLIIGALYYLVVAQSVLDGDLQWKTIFFEWPRASLKVILLALVWIGVFLVVTIPASCLVSLTSLAGFSLGQLTILLYGGFLLWLIFPLLFSAHGIFVNHLSVWNSIRAGVRITNATLPTTILFFVAVFLLTQGLDVLWRIPPANSWLTLLGIAGHAFVVTSLLSASFVYYRDADRWVTSMSELGKSLTKPNIWIK